MSALSLELLGHRSSSVLPVETLCLELQNIADEYSHVGGTVMRRVLSFLCVFLSPLHACRLRPVKNDVFRGGQMEAYRPASPSSPPSPPRRCFALLRVKYFG